MMLPLGGPKGHKGYALPFAVETLAAILPGLGFGVDPPGRHNDGAFMLVFDPGAFRPLA
jgi:LDH2 family malate/lactate/ureidoglycolate dehydrogenase